MIVVFSMMRRREDVSLPEFRRHWLDPHGPLVCKFPRLRRYSQNHVIESPATSPLARALRIDGFPELAYDNDADQEAATGSPEMAACDRDSPLFIGAVVRVVTEENPIIPRPALTPGLAKLMVVVPRGGNAFQAMRQRFDQAVRSAAGVTGFVENKALRQRGPRSTIDVLDVPVDTITEIWFDDHALMESTAARLDAAAEGQAAIYAVEEHHFIQ
jgi:uncharacterized protein (TIGR02118 family)